MTNSTIDMTLFKELQDTAGVDFAAELVGTFFEEAPLMLAELRSAQASAAADKFRRAAHSLKTNADTFGATRLGQLARELELSGVPASAAALGPLEAAYQDAAKALQEILHG